MQLPVARHGLPGHGRVERARAVEAARAIGRRCFAPDHVTGFFSKTLTASNGILVSQFVNGVGPVLEVGAVSKRHMGDRSASARSDIICLGLPSRWRRELWFFGVFFYCEAASHESHGPRAPTPPPPRPPANPSSSIPIPMMDDGPMPWPWAPLRAPGAGGSRYMLYAGDLSSIPWGARWTPPRSQVPSNVIKRAHPTRLGRPLGP
jgi:hypothetical protein